MRTTTAALQYSESLSQLQGAYDTEDDETHDQCVARAQTHALLAIASSLEALARHHTDETSPEPQ